MISIWHLLWIVPISAVGGVIFMVGIVIFDDFLWLASDKCEKRGDTDGIPDDL